MDARRTDGQTDGRTVGRFHCWLSGCLEGLMDGMMHGWKDAGMDASAVRRGQLGHAEGRRSVPASSSGRGVCTSPRLEATDWHVSGALLRALLARVWCVHTRGKRARRACCSAGTGSFEEARASVCWIETRGPQRFAVDRRRWHPAGWSPGCSGPISYSLDLLPPDATRPPPAPAPQRQRLVGWC